MYVRIDRRRKLPATVLLRALGLSNEEILEIFFETSTFTLNAKGLRLKLVAERLRGEIASFDIKDKDGKVIVEEGRRITARHVMLMNKANLRSLAVNDEYAEGKVLAHTIANAETGEVVAEANTELTGEVIQAMIVSPAPSPSTSFTRTMLTAAHSSPIR